MACGTPVVAFAVGGVSEQISHQIDGYLAKGQDIDDLIRGVNFIYAAHAPELAQRCRRKIEERFSAAAMVKKYFNLYPRVIKDYENRH